MQKQHTPGPLRAALAAPPWNSTMVRVIAVGTVVVPLLMPAVLNAAGPDVSYWPVALSMLFVFATAWVLIFVHASARPELRKVWAMPDERGDERERAIADVATRRSAFAGVETAMGMFVLVSASHWIFHTPATIDAPWLIAIPTVMSIVYYVSLINYNRKM